MKLDRSFCLVLAGLGALLSGCDAEGVSIGTEELCVKDERLSSAEERWAGEPVSNCAVLGENQLVNPGFETPIVSASCSETGVFCQFPATEVSGWATDSAEQVIELWLTGHMTVPSPEGSQFSELDARSRDTLHQDVALPPGQLMYWSLLHRGREGIDSMELQLGAPESLQIVATLSSPEDDWYSYSGLYRIGSDEALTRFALVSRNGEEKGNLVDDVVFAPVTEAP
jgi:hypothetical protein